MKRRRRGKWPASPSRNNPRLNSLRVMSEIMVQRLTIAALACAMFAASVGCHDSTSAATPGGGRGRGGFGRGRAGEGGPVPVVTATVAQKDVPVDIGAIGNIEAFTTISVRAQITGQLTEVLFREGDF